jgi:hypothetical protein
VLFDEKQAEADFRLEEYKALRKEIEIYVQESRALERYAIIGVGAIWVWLIANKVHDWVPWLIPLLLTLAVAARGFSVLSQCRQLGSYLADVEKYFGVMGWERTRPDFSGARATNVTTMGLLILSVILLFGRETLIAQ